MTGNEGVVASRLVAQFELDCMESQKLGAERILALVDRLFGAEEDLACEAWRGKLVQPVSFFRSADPSPQRLF